MNIKIKKEDRLESFCLKHDLSLREIDEAFEYVLECFPDLLYADVKTSGEKIDICVSTDMEDYYAFLAREKCLHVWELNLSKHTLDFIELSYSLV